MKALLVVIVSFLGILTGITFIFQEQRIIQLEKNIANMESGYKYTNDLIEAYDDRALSHFNNLQDSLEERIGDLERDMQDIKFIFNNKSRKSK